MSKLEIEGIEATAAKIIEKTGHLNLTLGPKFKDDLTKMYAIFNSLHPKNGLSKEIGILKRNCNAFKKHFPDYHDEVIKLASNEFTFSKLKRLNQDGNEKKGENKGDRTLRSKTATSRFSH